ncbi:MAG: hypothetical protein D6780_05175, partial [Candidatus Dadabacteria bacterium]
KPSPILLYGKQKLEVERYIEKNCKNYLILRISRAFSTEPFDNTFLTKWLKSLWLNEDISCAVDQIISPIHVLETAELIANLLYKEKNGLYHISGAERFSRLDALKILLSVYQEEGFKYSGKIKKVSLKDFKTKEPRGLNTTLLAQKVLSELNIKLKPFKYWCKDAVLKLKHLT